MNEEKRTVGKEGKLTPMTKWEIYEILITEASNEMVRCELLNRMHSLMVLKGGHIQMHEQFMGKYQAQVRQSKDSLEMLIHMLEQDRREEADKAKPVDKPVDKINDGERIKKKRIDVGF